MKRDSSYEAVKLLKIEQLGHLLPSGMLLKCRPKGRAKQNKRRAVNAYEDVAQLH